MSTVKDAVQDIVRMTALALLTQPVLSSDSETPIYVAERTVIVKASLHNPLS